MTRHHTRLTTTWLTSLAEELPEHRTATRPARWDFVARDLPPILERLATSWDHLVDFIPGRPEYREFDGTSDLGLTYRIECMAGRDGIVEPVGVEIDEAPPWMGEEPSVDV